jgi:hypothetical protein
MNVEKSKKKIKKPRCPICRKKINSCSSIKCKCDIAFCFKCRYPSVHNCKYDYKKDAREILEKNSVKVVASKVDII